MRITEIFYSIQGEGRRSGLPTVFVRTTGCHLRCAWCDASYTFTGGETKELDEVMAAVAAHPSQEVCFTGGEPLLQKDAWDLVTRLLEGGYRVLIETAGNIDFSRANDYAPEQRERLCISMDIKCPSSGESARNEPGLMADLRAPDQLKFVIADRADYDYAVAILRQRGLPPCPVYLNPVGGTQPADLTNWLLAETESLPVRVGIQLHKLVWGDEPGR